MTTVEKFLKKPIFSLIFSVLLGFLVSSIILVITGYSVPDVLQSLFEGVFSRPRHMANVIIKSTPIILTGVSIALAFKAGLFNMGAEGQFILGSVAALITGSILDLPPVLQVLAIIVSGIIAGALLGALTGFLKSKFGAHEVITGIMFNWMALHFSNFIVNLKEFHKPNSASTFPIKSSGFTGIRSNLGFLKDTSFSDILKTEVNLGIIIAVIVAIFMSIVINKTKKGYEICAIGLNEKAAESAGMNVFKNIIQVMTVSGGISGLAAALMVTGISPHSVSASTNFENNGFNGLAVALIASNSPIGCIFSGLFFGGLLYGGRSVQADVGTPSEIINIIIGVIIFFVAIAKIFPLVVSKFSKKNCEENHA
ncbi:MAG: ABC transporter permease [Oscillospiraceae bacterium]|jgi:simple sugar transport system permease protein|nr:ABC transporter permease [Oscillospiraceae bacterium]